MIFPVIQYPNPILNIPSTIVEDINSIRDLAVNLLETVKSEAAAGIAAVQIGVPKAIIIVSAGDGNYITMINPKILREYGEEVEGIELCLSYMKPTIIKRREQVEVSYTDLDGNRQYLLADGMLSRVIYHEHNHLLGLGIWSEGDKF